MKAGNEEVGPKIDLQLGLNYSNQCILKTGGLGAGANAVSKLGMRFVANSPLSELVWSPGKDSIFGVASSTDKPVDDVFAKPIAAVSIESDISGNDIPPKDLTSDSGAKPECKEHEEQDTGSKGIMEEMSSTERNSCDQVNAGASQISEANKERVSTSSGHIDEVQFDNLLPLTDEHEPSMEQNPLPRDQTSGGGDISVKNQAFETDSASSAKAYPIIEYKCFGAPRTKLTSPTRNRFEKWKSTAENDLQAFNCEAICGATSRDLISKSKQITDKSQDDKNLPGFHSPSNRKIRLFKRKHKEKGLSNGDINVKFSSRDEEESQESVESCCNSSGQFSTGKRLNFQQDLMVGNKRFRKQTQEVSSNSLVKQDSSFMNWISNMMKGFSLSIQEARSCMAHALAYPDQAHQWHDQRLITFNRNQNPEPKNTGFQFFFESMYSPTSKLLGEDSKNLDQENKVHGIDSTSMTCFLENDIPYRQHLNLDESERSRWIYEAGPSSHPKNEPVNFANSHESSKEREGKTSSSSLGGQKINTEFLDSSVLSERKEVNNCCCRSDTLGSQWISRFFPRPVAPLKISDHLIRSGGTQADSSDCSRLPHSHKHTAHSNKCKIEENHREQSADEAKELQNHSINKEAYNGTMDDKFHDSSMHKFNPLWPSKRFRNSEPMVSTFASRLDAIKYIISSNGTTDKASKQQKYFGSMRPPSCFVERKTSDVPEKIFYAVKKLRLSRTDILKWINSHMSLSHLNGFYLRLRLGKWEEGLGGTGYYVASINEARKQNSLQDTRTSIYVSVGGINCTVESRYISNQEFLEEEIIAWWSTSSKAGEGIPSEEDMMEKIKKKRMLGLEAIV
ncbi:hypothetical protein K1719_030628 [Acacia pycnantha]|nr:hypothetical protein K1719_030628 [Acacia pycnantha]